LSRTNASARRKVGIICVSLGFAFLLIGIYQMDAGAFTTNPNGSYVTILVGFVLIILAFPFLGGKLELNFRLLPPSFGIRFQFTETQSHRATQWRVERQREVMRSFKQEK
jgi:hypothetical protein